MTLDEIKDACQKAADKGVNVKFTFPRGTPIPQFWPNGVIVATTRDTVTYSFRPQQVMKMLRKTLLDTAAELKKV